jgi:hypothetical protein
MRELPLRIRQQQERRVAGDARAKGSGHGEKR